ncbi:unnamed protein product [Arctogadus glacialis]
MTSGRGEYGRHIREDVTSCNRDFLRGRIRIGLASKPNETTVSRLEKEASTGETHRNTEEIGSGLNGSGSLLLCMLVNTVKILLLGDVPPLALWILG